MCSWWYPTFFFSAVSRFSCRTQSISQTRTIFVLVAVIFLFFNNVLVAISQTHIIYVLHGRI